VIGRSTARNDDARPSRDTSVHRWIDLQTLMAIQDLQWRAKTIVHGLNTGMNRSSSHGFSVEFSEYRPFTDGDDPRTIDWKLFARSDRYYIKKFEDETNRRCYLVVDQSRSMGYTSIGYTKLDYARTLAATLALHLIRQRDAVGLVTLDATLGDLLTARYRPGQWKRILSLLERAPSGNTTDLATPLADVAQLVTRRSLIVVVSDFLVPVESLRAPLSFLRARGHEVALVRILDPNELDFRPAAPMMVRDLESGQEQYVDPATARTGYRERFAKHEAQWLQLAESLGIRCETFSTAEPLDAALHRFLAQRDRPRLRGSRSSQGDVS
jgi:uncharacterized protein (DUF58 family)